MNFSPYGNIKQCVEGYNVHLLYILLAFLETLIGKYL